jgi:hypothetical protein
MKWQINMSTALVYSPNITIRTRLSDELTFAKYQVDTIGGLSEIYALLKYEKRDFLIADTMKYDFYDLIKFCFYSNPSMHICLFSDLRVFCLYPLGDKPEAIISAMHAAGIKTSPRLLGQPQLLETVEMALI